jgi:hypothetical protein
MCCRTRRVARLSDFIQVEGHDLQAKSFECEQTTLNCKQSPLMCKQTAFKCNQNYSVKKPHVLQRFLSQ